jgi:hypothetical protein
MPFVGRHHDCLMDHSKPQAHTPRKIPGYGALNDLVNRIDPVELACALNAWLTENSELLPKSLALDGKKDDCELPVAQRLLDKDASRPRKKASGGQVLALLRGAILRLDDAETFESLNAGFHHHSAKPHAALRLLKTSPPKIS